MFAICRVFLCAHRSPGFISAPASVSSCWTSCCFYFISRTDQEVKNTAQWMFVQPLFEFRCDLSYGNEITVWRRKSQTYFLTHLPTLNLFSIHTKKTHKKNISPYHFLTHQSSILAFLRLSIPPKSRSSCFCRHQLLVPIKRD